MSNYIFLATEETAAVMTRRRSTSAFHRTGRISYSAECISAPPPPPPYHPLTPCN